MDKSAETQGKALLTFLFVLARIEEQRKFTADRYAVYKWLDRKCSPSPQGGGLLRNEGR